MGQKVNPISFRMPLTRNWDSKWFATGENYAVWVKSDFEIRQFLHLRLKTAGVAKIYIERSGQRLRVKIHSARPGVIIGRRGQDLDKLREQLQKLTGSETLLDIQEIKKPDLVAQLVADNIAIQLERRISTRRAMKKAAQMVMNSGAKGVRIRCGGRLGGAEIARKEEIRLGSVPLHALRANIDYGFSQAYTVYGVIGVKCWIYHSAA